MRLISGKDWNKIFINTEGLTIAIIEECEGKGGGVGKSI